MTPLDKAFAWDGAAFVPSPCSAIVLPNGWRPHPCSVPDERVTRTAFGSYALAMWINPRIRAVLVPALEIHGYASETDQAIHSITSAGCDTFAPQWHRTTARGFAFDNSHGRRSTVVARLNRDALGTLYHELFHTIYANLDGTSRSAIEAHGDVLRDVNSDIDTLLHEDRRDCRWMDSDEEAETYAFEHFATGRPQPFAVPLPRDVRVAFEAIMAGEYAHHIVAPPRL